MSQTTHVTKIADWLRFVIVFMTGGAATPRRALQAQGAPAATCPCPAAPRGTPQQASPPAAAPCGAQRATPGARGSRGRTELVSPTGTAAPGSNLTARARRSTPLRRHTPPTAAGGAPRVGDSAAGVAAARPAEAEAGAGGDAGGDAAAVAALHALPDEERGAGARAALRFVNRRLVDPVRLLATN